jgi:ent-kaurene oxidase
MVMKPITLSDGLHLPPGTRIAMAAREILLDPEVVSHASTFDPWRYLRAREKPNEEMKHRFDTTSCIKLYFGHGGQACRLGSLLQP